MEKRTLLIVGGLGYIGSNTCFMLQDKYNIITLDTKDEKLDCKHKHYCGDITTDTNLLDEIFTDNNIHSVIHFAAFKSVAESIKKSIAYYDNNITGLIMLLKIMEKYNCKNLIFSSSATVYGSQQSPLCENNAIGIGITNPYGTTKYICELILQDYCKHNDMNVIILRYFNPVGIPDGGYHENVKCPAENLMPNIIFAIKGKMTLQIYGTDYNTIDGTCERDFIHLEDLINGHECALQYIDNNNGLHIFNLGTGHPVTVLQIIQCMEKCLNVSIPYVMHNKRPGDVQTSYCDTNKSKIDLGWSSVKTLDDICNSYLSINN